MAEVTIGGRTFPVDAVLLDKDGTVINHDPVWNVWSATLTTSLANSLGLTTTQTRMLWESSSVNRIDTEPVEPATMEALRHRTRQLVTSLGHAPRDARRMVRTAFDDADDAMDRVAPRLNSNVEYLLNACACQHVPLAIVTGDDRARARQHLNRLNLLDYFSAIVGGDDTALGKPSGMPLRAACTQLDVNPSRTIYIGDSLVDVLAARDAGCQASVLLVDETKGLSRWMLEADILVYDYSAITVTSDVKHHANGGVAKWKSVLV